MSQYSLILCFFPGYLAPIVMKIPWSPGRLMREFVMESGEKLQLKFLNCFGPSQNTPKKIKREYSRLLFKICRCLRGRIHNQS